MVQSRLPSMGRYYETSFIFCTRKKGSTMHKAISHIKGNPTSLSIQMAELPLIFISTVMYYNIRKKFQSVHRFKTLTIFVDSALGRCIVFTKYVTKFTALLVRQIQILARNSGASKQEKNPKQIQIQIQIHGILHIWIQ